MRSPNVLSEKKKWIRSVRSRAKVRNLPVVGGADKELKIAVGCKETSDWLYFEGDKGKDISLTGSSLHS